MSSLARFNIMGDIMQITMLTPEGIILKELGTRLARARKQQGLAQTELAREAGIGVATLRRIESGQDSKLESWLKLLKAMNMTPAIDSLIPRELASPMDEARGNSRKRGKPSPPTGMIWGDQKS